MVTLNGPSILKYGRIIKKSVAASEMTITRPGGTFGDNGVSLA